MEFEHRVLNWNLDTGHVLDFYQTDDGWIEVVLYNGIKGRTRHGSNQFVVKVIEHDSEFVTILDLKRIPQRLHKSVVPNTLKRSALKAALKDERDRVLVEWQVSGDGPQGPLWQRLCELNKVI